MHPCLKKKLYAKNAPQARFFLWNKMRHRQDLLNKMSRRIPFFDKFCLRRSFKFSQKKLACGAFFYMQKTCL